MLSIECTVKEGVSEVKLEGRLDANAAKEADIAFTQAAEEAKDVVLDLSELVYIASAGLRTFKRLRDAVRANGGTLVLRDVQDNVMEVLEVTGFAAMFTIE